MKIDKFELLDDDKLLLDMTIDQKNQKNEYHPGIYWLRMTNNTLIEIKKYGITKFRGTTNSIGQSCSDNCGLDIRTKYHSNKFKGAIAWLTSLYPLNKIFDSQINIAKGYINQSRIFAQEFLALSPLVKELIAKYKIPYSILGDCFMKVRLDDKVYALHYLNLLEQHHNIAKYINFNKVNSVFEIGGGFGINIHLLIENYPNIRKVIYLDIPPHLYIGTQYLKAFYGMSVIDYRETKNLKNIEFSKNNDLEILCIAPWQIEYLRDSVDLFMNSHSFVEMPQKVVENYINKLSLLPKFDKTSIALVSYDGFSENTIHPDKLKTFFKNKKFSTFKKKMILNSSRDNFYYISSENN